ncbi:MAG TPA: type II secretion system F family protein [Candidatus Baltobacteraceae bacterium]|nr:type II secretion system F family protein [Candidatus Baltobacteraceae bacterium]
MVGTTQTSIFAKLKGGEERAEYGRQFADLLDRAGMQNKPQEILGGIAAVTALLWIVLAFVMRPAPIVGVLLLPLCAGVACGGFWMLVQMKLRKRLDTFVQQLELALRLVASGVRIGLGLRQALTIVIEEMPNPARHEYMRVVGQTNIGVSVYDALDNLAKRMPSHETMMMSRAIRIQSQTGGDLSKILEHLAETIKERRRIQRKIQAITAEGRASAAILSGLPPFLAGFISLTEPQMGHALMLTAPGHVALFIVFILETCGVVTLMRMLKVDV